MHISIGRSATDTWPTQCPSDWDGLVSALKEAHQNRKPGKLTLAEYLRFKSSPIETEFKRAKYDKDDKWFNCAVFVNNGERNKENVASVHAIGLDSDDGFVTLAWIRDILAGFAWVAYTSYSHSPECEKWRIIVKLERPATPEEFEATWLELWRRFGELTDKNTKNPDRIFYIPGKVCADQLRHAQFEVGEGVGFPVSAPLPLVATAKPDQWTEEPVPHWPHAGDTDEQCVQRIRNHRPIGWSMGKITGEQLWTNDLALDAEYKSDRSTIDLAFANLVLRETGYDCERADRLMRQSELNRDKWERSGYLRNTILKAMDGAPKAAEFWAKLAHAKQQRSAQPSVTVGGTPVAVGWTDAPMWHVPGGADDEELIRRAEKSKKGGPKFKALWSADEVELATLLGDKHPYTRERGEYQLAHKLLWWTGGDCARTARLMEDSGFGHANVETILKALESVAKHPPEVKAAKEPTPDAAQRETIKLVEGMLHIYIEDCIASLSDVVYTQGVRGLVHIGRACERVAMAGETQKRDDAQAVTITASSAWLQTQLMRKLRFLKFDGRSKEWVDKDCPLGLAGNIHDRGVWPSLHPLRAISPVPVLRADMSLQSEPGYDITTGVYYHPTIALPPMIERPTRVDALVALARLREPFNEFPYTSPEAESVFISHILTAVMRASMDTSPVYFYTSPTAGTGKTLLAGMASLIAQGTPPAQSPYVDGDELRKVLLASLMAGDTTLTLDNVPNGYKVKLPELCIFATSAVYSARALGTNDKMTLDNRCLVTITGNNITPASDLARRSEVCRLDTNRENPQGRTFRLPDLTAHVLERRGQMLADVLTIVRAHYFAGAPSCGPVLASFSRWSQLVRDPLVWLGMADPVLSQQAETDDESEPIGDALHAIAEAGLTNFTITQLMDKIAVHKGLREAIVEAECREPVDSKSLGFWLRRVKGRVAKGLRVDNDKKTKSVRYWTIRYV